MKEYPSEERKNCGYSIRFIKALMDSDAIHDFGVEAVMLAVFIASREDRLHYSKPPMFWRAELMERFGTRSPKGLIRIREKAIAAGLIHYEEGTRVRPGIYWTLVPRWLSHQLDPFRKRNASELTRSQNGTHSGTDNGTDNGTLSIPSTQNPKQSKKRSRFQKPTIAEIKAYCRDRRNGIDAERFLDYYEANGWVQGKGKPIQDWKATVRTWERNGNNRSTVDDAPTTTFDPKDRL